MKVCNPDTYNIYEDHVQCILCPLKCKIKHGEAGVCRVRKNELNKLFLSNYGMVVSTKLDTLLSRPVYLWKNNRIKSLTLGLTGCNNYCPFCQNHKISQAESFPHEKFLSPSTVVEQAKKHGVDFISMTFTEPLVWFEYFSDVAYEAKRNGVKVCLKTSGHISPEYVDSVLNLIDVVNVDIKPLAKNYQEECGIVEQGAVWNFLYRCVFEGIHTEISHIVMEGLNDSDEALMTFCKGVGKCHDSKIGIHLLRHYPAYKSNYPVTSDKVLNHCRDKCMKFGFSNVFIKDVS